MVSQQSYCGIHHVADRIALYPDDRLAKRA
jgi:hypothetical protein